MQTRSLGQLLSALVLIAAWAAPAAAQTPPADVGTAPAASSFFQPRGYREPVLDLSIGYLFVRHVDGNVNLPRGGYFDVNSLGPVGIAGEVGISADDARHEWRFLAGPRFAGRDGRSTAALEILVGGTHLAPDDVTRFTIAPGLVIDAWGRRRAGIRFKANYLAEEQNTRWSNGFSIGLGIVFRD